MTKNRSVRSDVNVDEVVFGAVTNLIGKGDSWVGTMTDLGVIVRRSVSRKEVSVLPRSPSALRVVLDRVVNRLRNRRISVRFGRTTDHTRTRYVRFAR